MKTETPLLMKPQLVISTMKGLKTMTRRLAEPRLRVRLPSEVRSDVSLLPGQRQLVARPGTYDAELNRHGAVRIKVDGRPLGLRPGDFHFVCPYANTVTRWQGGRWAFDLVGDSSLWVRETLKEREDGWVYGADGAPVQLAQDDPRYLAMVSWAHHKEGSTCVSIHMPRWASRLTLPVTRVRIEHLQEITEEDARAEGVRAPMVRSGGKIYPAFATLSPYHGPRDADHVFRCEFASLWEEINGKRAGWAADPWVWVVEWKALAKGRKRPRRAA